MERTTWTTAEREALLLARYATHSSDTRGRRIPETEHPYRGPFQRDRDRILHSAAFRRLSGKMQVFTGERGDYHRTRLTHTQEVASIARTIGRALRLNEDLVEALALFHDIGHPPFGHAGEDALRECLAEHGGFSHNRHGLTIAEELEWRYTDQPGLNLSLEVLESQTTRVDKRGDGPAPLLEAQVVDLADSITYDAHDTDDAVKLGMVTLDELATIPLVRDTIDAVRRRYGAVTGHRLRKAVVHDLIDRQVGWLLEAGARELAEARFHNAEELRASGWRLAPAPEVTEAKRELEGFLYRRVYRHPDLVEVRRRAQRRLAELFQTYLQRPELLPELYQRRAAIHGLERAAGEYIAGMTDRFCDEQHARLVE